MRALILLLALANIAATPYEAVERARIQAEKRALEAQFQQTEQACRENFQVTVCVDAAKAQRRSALASLREQQTRLDDDDRRRRAAERLQAIDKKRSAIGARPPASAASAAAPSSTSASASASASARPTAAAPPAASTTRRRAGDGGAAAASKRASAAQTRLQQAEKERLKIAQRVAAAKKGVAPLPVPAASAPGPR